MGKIPFTPKCKRCGKRYALPTSSDGLPNMIGFQLDDGRTINLCRKCIITLGELNDAKDEAGLDKFFKEIGVDKKEK